MGYKILEGFSLRLSNFCPQNSCLFSPGLNIFCFTSLEVVGPEAFVSLHSSSWDASFSTVYDAASNDFADFIWML
jgi:hypothetical protein